MNPYIGQEAYEHLRRNNEANNDWGQRLHALLTEALPFITDPDLRERAEKLLAEE